MSNRTPQDAILQLAAKYGWDEGKNAEYYSAHGKWQVTKRGVHMARAQEAKAGNVIDHGEPKIQDAGGRVSVSGVWQVTKEGGEVVYECWTTGEGNPGGKAVEGSHPVAMAEKRWKSRGILNCLLFLAGLDEGAGIYSEDEFEPGFNQGPSGASDRHEPQPAPDAGHRADPPQERQERRQNSGDDKTPVPDRWGNLMGRIAEQTGMERSQFELPLLSAASYIKADPIKGKDEWWPVTNDRYRSIKGFDQKNTKWAYRVFKNAESLVAPLSEGKMVQIETHNGPVTILPKDMVEEDVDLDDMVDIPF